jgi:NitT/TauT family transport system substrate-binding protein
VSIKSRTSKVAAGLAVAALALAACGSEAGPADGNEAQTTKVRVSTIPIANLAAFFYAQENGIFTDHGLEVESVSSTGGSAGIAAMLSGSVELVYTNYVSVFTAYQQNLPVTLVAGNDTNVAEGDRDSSGMLVAEGIEDANDLAGKTVGTAKLNNINMVYSKLWLEDLGVDAGNVNFVEMPYPEQLAAVLAGQIEAAFLPEPFLTQGTAAGLQTLGYPFRLGTDGITPLAGFVADKTWAEDNEDAIASFNEAMAEAVEEGFAPDNRAKLVDAILANTKMERADAEQMIITTQSPEIDRENLAEMAELLAEAGSIKPGLDIEDLIFGD